MPRYWRDPADDTVHLSRPGCPIDEFDVIVLPLEKWRRLVELVKAQTLASENCGWLTKDAAIELDAILASVEVDDAV